MGSITGLILENSAKSKIFNLPKHYPVVKVRPAETGLATVDSRRPAPQRSAGRWPPRRVEGTDQGSDGVSTGSWDGIRVLVPCGFPGSSRVSSICLPAGGGGGGDEETRTPDPLLAKEVLYQLSYVPSASAVMVGVSGLEPETSALSGQCSNQLS